MPIHFGVTGVNFGVTDCKKVKIVPMGISCPDLVLYFVNWNLLRITNYTNYSQTLKLSFSIRGGLRLGLNKPEYVVCCWYRSQLGIKNQLGRSYSCLLPF